MYNVVQQPSDRIKSMKHSCNVVDFMDNYTHNYYGYFIRYVRV
jgi:hypothetical protein